MNQTSSQHNSKAIVIQSSDHIHRLFELTIKVFYL